MAKNENIPQEILAFAKDELDFWKQSDYPHAGEMEYLGEHDGVKYYKPYYPPKSIIGFPNVYSIDKQGKCKEYNTYDALDVISLFCKD